MSSLRDQLRGVPQDPRFHPEGDVWTHTRLVRRALGEAVELSNSSSMMRSAAGAEALPTARERDVLRAAAWCHDLGKSGATRELRDGRVVAPGHETARSFNPAARRLGPAWRRVWAATSPADRKTFVYLVTRHMAINDRKGLSPQVARDLAGKHPARRRRALLLVTFMMMDRLGCASATRVADARMVLEAAERAVLIW